MDNIKLRITFSKTGRARFISHLDLNRTMQRALKRARIPIWYTEGFNPHAYIMFPLALSLGVDSKCELMDISITEDIDFKKIKESLNSVLPEGLQVINVALQDKKHTEIAFSEYRIVLSADCDNERLLEEFKSFLNLEKIEVEKKTKKKGISLIDIKPLIIVLSANVCDNGVEIMLRLPSGTSTNINPSLVIDAFNSMFALDITVYIERTKILCTNGEIFS